MKGFFNSSGTGFWYAVAQSYRLSSHRYFWHNLGCELRRCRYETCYGYKNTWYDRFLFSMGVFIIDPSGRYHSRQCKWQRKWHKRRNNDLVDMQWIRHPLPWVSRRAKKQIAWLKLDK